MNALTNTASSGSGSGSGSGSSSGSGNKAQTVKAIFANSASAVMAAAAAAAAAGPSSSSQIISITPAGINASSLSQVLRQITTSQQSSTNSPIHLTVQQQPAAVLTTTAQPTQPAQDNKPAAESTGN